jgi:hypothetical protein
MGTVSPDMLFEQSTVSADMKRGSVPCLLTCSTVSANMKFGFENRESACGLGANAIQTSSLIRTHAKITFVPRVQKIRKRTRFARFSSFGCLKRILKGRLSP